MYVEHKSAKGARIAAAIIDYCLISVVAFIVSMINTFLSMDFSSTNEQDMLRTVFDSLIITQSIILSFNFLYFTLFPFITKGRTIGKLISGIRVVSNDYTKASFLQLLIRNVYFILGLTESTILFFVYKTVVSESDLVSFQIFSAIIGMFSTLIYLTIFIMILATENGVGLHDIIARTVVVKKDFQVDDVNYVNALERRDMSWANFADNDKESIDILNSSEEDEIELFKE